MLSDLYKYDNNNHAICINHPSAMARNFDFCTAHKCEFVAFNQQLFGAKSGTMKMSEAQWSAELTQ